MTQSTIFRHAATSKDGNTTVVETPYRISMTEVLDQPDFVRLDTVLVRRDTCIRVAINQPVPPQQQVPE